VSPYATANVVRLADIKSLEAAVAPTTTKYINASGFGQSFRVNYINKVLLRGID